MDRRYGNPYQFEEMLLGHLNEAGFRFLTKDASGEGVITLRVEPRMMSAMCDRTPGTNTDRSCRTIGEVDVDILNAEPELELKRTFRVRGRCGADELMDIPRMSEHVAAMIDYELHQGEDRRRPSSRC